MKLTKREKVLLVLLLIVIIGAAYYSLFFRPFTEELSSVNDQIERLNKNVYDYEIKSNFLGKLKEKVEKLDKEINEYIEKNNIYSGYNPAVILVYLEKLFAENNAEQLNVDLSEPVSEKYYKTAFLTVQFKSDYDNAKNIINEIESGNYKQYVTSINIRKSHNADEKPDMLQVDVTFTHIFDIDEKAELDYPFMNDVEFSKDNPFK